jgi:hypothetical protein
MVITNRVKFELQLPSIALSIHFKPGISDNEFPVLGKILMLQSIIFSNMHTTISASHNTLNYNMIEKFSMTMPLFCVPFFKTYLSQSKTT